MECGDSSPLCLWLADIPGQTPPVVQAVAGSMLLVKQHKVPASQLRKSRPMTETSNEYLIGKAASVVNPRRNGEFTMGDVGCALVSERNNFYVGVCIDTGSGMGFCAEHNAIGSMVTAGESRIKKIVAVWLRDGTDPYVLSPCGRCREFMKQIDPGNLEAEVVLAKDKSVPLKELLPYHDWYCKI